MTLGFSPCPNDTFIFDAIVNSRIDTGGLDFEIFIADVEELNKKALQGGYDIIKVSVQTYFKIKDRYEMLNSGAAIGKDCGPLLVSKNKYSYNAIKNLTVAIPGKNTTANLLLKIAFPDIREKVELKFSEIEEAIVEGMVDAGLIIHESRFTYQEKGLIKIIDLGEYWESITGCPLPLGCIMIRKDIDISIKQTFNKLLKQSVEYAMSNPLQGMDFVKSYAREIKEDVIKKHIDLYVNNYTKEIGEDGREAIERLEEYYRKIEI